MDVGYWESLLHQLKAYMARARLHDRHQAMLQKQLFKLKQEVRMWVDSVLVVVELGEEYYACPNW